MSVASLSVNRPVTVLMLFLGIILLVSLYPDPYARILSFVQDGVIVTILVTISTFLLMLRTWKKRK